MRQRQGERAAAASEGAASQSVDYEVMDVRALTWADGTLDSVVDKARAPFRASAAPGRQTRARATSQATLDTLLNLDDGAAAARQMVAEAARVLRCGGVFLCISHDDGRLPMLMGTEQGAGPEAAAALPWRLVELCEVWTVCLSGTCLNCACPAPRLHSLWHVADCVARCARTRHRSGHMCYPKHRGRRSKVGSSSAPARLSSVTIGGRRQQHA